MVTLRDNRQHFGAMSIINHWVIAVLIIGMLGFGLYLDALGQGPEQRALLQIHKAIGVIVLVLVVWRVLWRLSNGFPDDVAQMPAWQATAAKAVHYGLLTAIVLMPVSGYVTSTTGGHAVSMFGLFTLPALPENETVSAAAADIHAVVAYCLMGLITVHVLAALKHHVIDRDPTLLRMIGRARHDGV